MLAGKLVRRIGAVALSLAVVASGLGLAGKGATAAYAAEAGIAQPYESLFAGDRIIDVKVTIDDADWESILASPLDKEYKSATVEVDGNVMENVGFSTKGNLTLKAVASMTDSDRYSFRLKFDKYEKSQTLLGLDKMVLNNSYADPSFLREYLHYEALRAIGLDAPLTVFTNLYINGELYGFYVGVEAIDDSYLERNFGEDYADGVLYDTDEKSYLQEVEGSNYDSLTVDLGEDENKAALKNFISVLNDMPDGEKGDIEKVLDVDTALKYIAANAVLGNYDSYNGDKGHNYMLYGDENGKFSVLPWDFNMSFNGYSGGSRNTSAAGTANTDALTASVDIPVLGISMDSVPMINNLLKVTEYKEQYLTYVKELVEYLSGIQARITELADLIRPDVQSDPTKFYTMEQFEANVTYSAAAAGAPSGADGTPGAAAGGASQGGIAPGAAADGAAPGGMTPPTDMGAGFPEGGMVPPAGVEGATPPTRPEGMGNGGGGPNQGQGMGTMAAGSIMTFALNRLANLQEQLGLAVTPLPETTATQPETPSTGGISVVYNGSKLQFPDQQPVIQKQTVLVPVKTIFDKLGATVKWDQAAKTVTATWGENKIVLTIGSTTAYVNGKAVTTSVPAAVLGNRTLVPVRFVSEALGLKVAWSQANSTVSITTP
jgi:spore coat protein H